MKGIVSSFQSLGTLDGPGVRAVVFAAGCPLRCIYCHNPETWEMKGEEVDAETLVQKILRFKPFIKNGGVTFSGGEPLLQGAFFAEVAERLKKENLHVALDTCGRSILLSSTSSSFRKATIKNIRAEVWKKRLPFWLLQSAKKSAFGFDRSW